MTENGGAPVGYSAFISHASDEAEIASKVCSQLESTGFRCWIAPRDVRPGQDYPEEIIRGIEQSKCLVLILSQKANNSKFVRSEVERAYSKGKPVFPVRIEEVLPSRALELFISTKHWIDAWHGDLSDHATNLANEIAQHADLDVELPAAFRRKIRIKNLARAGGTVIAALIIAIVVGLVMRSNPSTSSVTPAKLTVNSEPAKTFFMGDLVQADHPLKASYMLTDGWDDRGVYDALNNVRAFEVWEIKDGNVTHLYGAEPKLFTNQYRATKTFEFSIDGLPKKIISCLQYEIPRTKTKETVLQGFNFDKPKSRFGTFPATEASAPKTIVSTAPCGTLVANYATTQMHQALSRWK